MRTGAPLLVALLACVSKPLNELFLAARKNVENAFASDTWSDLRSVPALRHPRELQLTSPVVQCKSSTGGQPLVG